MVEKSFLPKSGRPTSRQCQAIGRVVVTYTILENCLERILARLALAPDFPALALTNDLGPDNRIAALKSLLALHRGRYAYNVVSLENLDKLAALVKPILDLKERRNRVVHRVWIRADDENMLGVRFRAKLPSDNPKEQVNEEWLSVRELQLLAKDAQTIADALFVLLQQLPEQAEPLPPRLPSR